MIQKTYKEITRRVSAPTPEKWLYIGTTLFAMCQMMASYQFGVTGDLLNKWSVIWGISGFVIKMVTYLATGQKIEDNQPL